MSSTYYQQKINKAIDYINNHLDEPINVKILAEQALFSPFHFQRIYKALQGESPYETLLRLRLEKAVFSLKYHTNLNLTQIAFDSGFPSYENFSRQFKARYQLSPSAFRKDKKLHNSRIYQETQPNDFYHCIHESRKEGVKHFPVEIEYLDEIPIAFVRAIFGADGSGLVERYLELIDWAEKHTINYQGPMKRFGMSIDNTEVTPASKYRYDFALTLDQPYQEEGLIEMGTIPKAPYATLHCQGDLTVVAQAWDYLYKYWLPNSNYIPLHYPAIEEFIQGPEEIGWEMFNIKCRIPIINSVN